MAWRRVLQGEGLEMGQAKGKRWQNIKRWFLAGYKAARPKAARSNPAVRKLATGKTVKVSAVRVRTVVKNGRRQRALDLIL
ncbi:MAG: hypothetical protein IPK75_20575 [Acidobacteria bacterium]|nr:hypothetical protein [Acidobacteriota bacterium]